MADIRNRVEDDRGIIKKIETYIPGYRGYRLKEDLRIADSLLRNQLSNELGSVLGSVERSRETISKNMDLLLINDIGELGNSLTAVMNKLRHAQQGYSGISPDIRVEEGELNKLYEWDLSLLQIIDILRDKSTDLEGLVTSRSPRVQASITEIKKEVTKFQELLQKRMDTVANISVR